MGNSSNQEAKGSSPRAPLYRNTVSLLGLIFVVVGALLMLLALIGSMVMGGVNPYAGIVIYLVFPAIIVTGVAGILLGMRLEAGKRRRLSRSGELPYPKIDLNEPVQRRRFVIGAAVGSVVAALLAWGGYQGFHYTESVKFCGETCHVVMQPEYTAYQASPHAKVACVECHVGSGVDWYVKSKLSGLRQVYGVLTGDYDRPIPTPVEHLRPARETCEECHWPQKFFGARVLQLPHVRYDETNTAEQIELVLKTGGGSIVKGSSNGIHWHMVVANKVEYVADDRHAQHIPWARVTHQDGSVEEYFAAGEKRSREELLSKPPHVVDCMDCHNRPSHRYPKPDTAVDTAIFEGAIAKDLPWIKKVGVDALLGEYPTRAAARDGIRRTVKDFYAAQYPDVAVSRAAEVDRAIDALVTIRDRGVFPEMNVTWGTYPENIGHRFWPGCFRCHDGRHVTREGKVLESKCDGTCHTLPKRSVPTALGEAPTQVEEKWHPWELPNHALSIPAHEGVLCHNCHAAGQRPKRTCNDCHAE